MKRTTLFAAGLATVLTGFGAIAQAQQLPPRGDLDRDGIINAQDDDRDGDGLANRSDPNPNVFNRTYVVQGARDLDGDGIIDRHDRDRDGDGIPNARDERPNIPDVVSRGGRGGRDRDGDGVINREDRFPDNPRRS